MADVSGEALGQLLTAQSDPRYGGIERLDTLGTVRLMNADVPGAVGWALPAVAEAIDAIVERLRHGAGCAPSAPSRGVEQL